MADKPDDDGSDSGDDEDVEPHPFSSTTTATTHQVVVAAQSPGAPHVVFFPYPAYLNMTRTVPSDTTVEAWLPDKTIRYHGTRRYLYNAVKNALKAAHAVDTTKRDWNLFWGRHLEPNQYAALRPGQKVNHFPGSLELGRKDKLCQNILRMQRKFGGSFYQIIPETYITGGKDCKPFMTALASSSKALWILKPPNQCCGRGIKIIPGGSDYTYEPAKRYVAQRYIMNPYLINGFKFDIRLYVLVTSYHPLRVYLFPNGLVRFCTEKYSTSKKDVSNRFGHLTNYSVNKKNKAAFQTNQDAAADGEGSKWSYHALQAYFKAQGMDPSAIHNDIAALIVKTLMCVEAPLVASLHKHTKELDACFELYGFDILLDANVRPWLLEVNVFPSMSSSSPMDKRIKSILVCDTFQLVGIPAVDLAADATNASASMPRPKGFMQQDLHHPTLDDNEATWIQALEDEARRVGHFQRIFPTLDTIKYLDFFEKPRPGNAVYATYLQRTSSASALKRTTGATSTNPPRASGKPARRKSLSTKFSQAKAASLSYHL
ncbi:hypothetical protein H310_11348 [Aphanomyces invadans]|uniref:Tubulin--tyrosine ligase-like protein 5 n=1 Tax=Aphanomyces invadans TaxID=157072 RepID=A0A024TLL5_9STRA|nr:hypothetical protein H310_11348 [Aphanomyces invadans]ETV95050.1 hypothetical protein H310_11348 [Aphanomyces invadans]|eukprot:XP_008876223.1 hypothetical protein H310_11348 [Aphanomyces invadans]